MWDLIVAGAGPAGTIAAIVAARAGARVLLIDRARFPRDKLCGDTVNPGTINLLRRLKVAEQLDAKGGRVSGMLLTGPNGVCVAGRYPPPLCGRSIARRDLDQWLLEDAVRAGVQVEEEVTVRRASLQQSRGSPARVGGVIVRSPRRRDVLLNASVTIAADGRRSPIAFGLGLAAHPRSPRRWAIGAYFDAVADLTTSGEMHIRDGEYLGIAPQASGLANVCLVSTRARLSPMKNPGAILAAAIQRNTALGDRFASARLVTRPAVLGPLAVDVRQPGAPGLLLAGDAAGFIDPMTGDGLRFAVEGGAMAAGMALEMLATADPNGYLRLAQQRRSAFAAKWRFNRTFRRLVDIPIALRWAAAGAAALPSSIDLLVAIAGDCPTAGWTPGDALTAILEKRYAC